VTAGILQPPNVCKGRASWSTIRGGLKARAAGAPVYRPSEYRNKAILPHSPPEPIAPGSPVGRESQFLDLAARLHHHHPVRPPGEAAGIDLGAGSELKQGFRGHSACC
jgi:hypothetical protein